MIIKHASITLLAAICVAGIAACGGDSGSKTPTSGGSQTTAASPTGNVSPGASPSSATTATGTASGTRPAGGSSPQAASSPGAVGSVNAGSASSPVIPVNVTVRPDGTATNPQGTPVVLPTAGAQTSGSPGPTTAASPTARILVDAPSEASEDFTVTIRVEGVTAPYVAFNVFMTFDASILAVQSIKAGTALALTPEEMFCAKSPASRPGVVGIGCTALESTSVAGNGELAIIRFKRLAPGSAQLHLNAVAQGGAAEGTYIASPGASLAPDNVLLSDATVEVS